MMTKMKTAISNKSVIQTLASLKTTDRNGLKNQNNIIYEKDSL